MGLKAFSRRARKEAPRPADREGTAPNDRRGSSGLIARIWRPIALALLLLTLLGVGALSAAYYFFIVKHPGEAFQKERIMQRIAVETPVFYRDGKEKVGVFFNETHRKYLVVPKPGEAPPAMGPEGSGTIPRLFLNAVVASEDKKFYRHHGIDFKGILRAAIANVKAGRIVQGGSTLTQQTAENIFHHGRTFKDKLFELIDTLKLEAHFTKDEILEFYTNQFYVNSNGRGLAIAARYYFDKTPDELTLVECAFIAGSVKAPSRYNPFIKRTEAGRRAAERRAFERKNYVIDNMFELGMISTEEYAAARAAPVPFRKGRFQYDRSVALDYVEALLHTERFQQLFEEHGISNLATSGIRIYTTLDKDIEEAALYVVRRNLSRVHTLLHGYAPPERPKRMPNLLTLRPHEFHLGTIREIIRGEKIEESRIVVDFGHVEGVVPYAGIEEMAHRIRQHEGGERAKLRKKDVRAFLDSLEVGAPIYTSVLDLPEGEPATLAIEQKPKVQGALVVLDKGEIRAMVGGFDNTNFNRALYGKRQVGSVFKPIVYLAALQLGWSPLDPLINSRQFFAFQGEFYYPKPDHHPHATSVSMTWAGTKSENLATIYLLFHLLDKLNFVQFREIARKVDMAPRKGEKYRDFVKRIRRMGIRATPEQFKRGLFEEVKQELIPELIFDGREREIAVLDTLQYGAGYAEEEIRIKDLLEIPILDEYGKPIERKEEEVKEGEEEDEEEQEELSEEEREEYFKKLDILKQNYLRLKEMNDKFRRRREVAREIARKEEWRRMSGEELAAIVPIGFYYPMKRDPLAPSGVIFTTDHERSGKDLEPIPPERLLSMLHEADTGLRVLDPLASDKVRIDGMLPSTLIEEIARLLDEKLIRLQKRHAAYSLRALFYHRDFKTLVGLRYLVKMAHRIGISSDLQPILSFPLGSNVVTLLEVALAYQTFQGGKIYAFDEGPISNEASIISRIEDAKGNVIFARKRRALQVIDPKVAYLASSILRSVIHYGTGIRAYLQVFLRGEEIAPEVLGKRRKYRVPLFGKTGTADRYTNAAFVGFVPYPTSPEEELHLENAYTIAAYTGYDDNREMRIKEKRRYIRFDGARGALPAWIAVANAIIRRPDYLEKIDLDDLRFQVDNTLSILQPEDIFTVRVGSDSGLYPVRAGERGFAFIEACGRKKGATPKLKRIFAPFVELEPSQPVADAAPAAGPSVVSMREEGK